MMVSSGLPVNMLSSHYALLGQAGFDRLPATPAIACRKPDLPDIAKPSHELFSGTLVN